MAEIKLGDRVHCVECGEEFELTRATYFLTPTREVVVCPHCNIGADVFAYLMGSSNTDMSGEEDG